MAKQRFSDRVLERAAADRPRATGFLSRLPPDVQAELLELRRALHAGIPGVTGKSLARSIVADCQENGLPICGVEGVRDWLAKRE
ncbi:MAG: hypothetical protein KGR24_05955 [Planctomycetes bacterium]|nr:hypothetical protein [Planctomycetota bacterium]